jgi:hypothetical protein
MSVTENDSPASPDLPASPGLPASPASPDVAASLAEPALLTIGQLSAETGVPTSTIRFWERKASAVTPRPPSAGWLCCACCKRWA